ncbi:MAG: hypothetical protein NTV88_05350 [Candidatus Micrarchaeota archaeon]|nr:hypothetical protein [Candidatus Micrarchaeota archaeon]
MAETPNVHHKEKLAVIADSATCTGFPRAWAGFVEEKIETNIMITRCEHGNIAQDFRTGR